MSDRSLTRRPHTRALLWPLAAVLLIATTGCGEAPSVGESPELGGSGLSLPPGFVPVDKPEATRKGIFEEIHRARTRAMHEAHKILPMDEPNLPVNNKVAFDKRVADHKALVDAYLETAFTALAERYGITTADLAKIEEEAQILRWLPPPDEPAAEEPAKKEEKTSPDSPGQGG